MTYEERLELRRRIDRVKRERLRRASQANPRDEERRRASWRAYARRRREAQA